MPSLFTWWRNNIDIHYFFIYIRSFVLFCFNLTPSQIVIHLNITISIVLVVSKQHHVYSMPVFAYWYSFVPAFQLWQLFFTAVTDTATSFIMILFVLVFRFCWRLDIVFGLIWVVWNRFEGWWTLAQVNYFFLHAQIHTYMNN